MSTATNGIESNLSSSKVRNSSKMDKKKRLKTIAPRVSTHYKNGKTFKIYRCQTCNAFVSKDQPRCFTCLGIPHIGRKKSASMHKNCKEVTGKMKDNRKDKTSKKTVSSTKVIYKKNVPKFVVKPGSSIDGIHNSEKDMQEPVRVCCVYCFRKTKSKNGICMFCKKENQISLTQSASALRKSVNDIEKETTLKNIFASKVTKTPNELTHIPSSIPPISNINEDSLETSLDFSNISLACPINGNANNNDNQQRNQNQQFSTRDNICKEEDKDNSYVSLKDINWFFSHR